MHGVYLKSIITDQDKAICKAVGKVFPNTCHRYCKWHLYQHIGDKLLALRSLYGGRFFYLLHWM